MTTSKHELRSIMLAVITGKEAVQYAPDKLGVLFRGVAEVIARRAGKPTHEPRLSDEDAATATEVFSDLILERIITPGRNSMNPLPCFRVHSEATFQDDAGTPS